MEGPHQLELLFSLLLSFFSSSFFPQSSTGGSRKTHSKNLLYSNTLTLKRPASLNVHCLDPRLLGGGAQTAMLTLWPSGQKLVSGCGSEGATGDDWPWMQQGMNLWNVADWNFASQPLVPKRLPSGAPRRKVFSLILDKVQPQMLLCGNVSNYTSIDDTAICFIAWRKRSVALWSSRIASGLRSQVSVPHTDPGPSEGGTSTHATSPWCAGLHMPCPPAATWSDTTWMAKRSIQWRCRTREEVASKCLFYLGHPHLSRNCSSSLPWTTSCFYIDQSRQIIAVAWVITSNNSSNLGLWEEVVDATLDLANIMLSTGSVE